MFVESAIKLKARAQQVAGQGFARFAISNRLTTNPQLATKPRTSESRGEHLHSEHPPLCTKTDH